MVKFIEQQCLARELGIKNKPVASVDEALVQNYEKGIIAGMRMAMAFPTKMMELDREAFNNALQEERINGG